MGDKSPKKNNAKKPAKTIKEKRAAKHAKSDQKSGHTDIVPPRGRR